MTFTLSSPAFGQHESIPVKHTCDGDGTPPSLKWNGAPDGTKSFALIVDDPDAPDPKAPQRTFVHWIAYDIPAAASGIGGDHKEEMREGMNDGGSRGYTGPCPPVGRHRYFFKLYALDTQLGDLGSPRKADLERAVQGHVLEHAELVGTYEHATSARR
jgi:Raf kinase inhibitor-like YbhB/YbcL family protein